MFIRLQNNIINCKDIKRLDLQPRRITVFHYNEAIMAFDYETMEDSNREFDVAAKKLTLDPI